MFLNLGLSDVSSWFDSGYAFLAEKWQKWCVHLRISDLVGTLLLGFVFTVLYCVAYDFFFPYPDTYNSEKKTKEQVRAYWGENENEVRLMEHFGDLLYTHTHKEKRKKVGNRENCCEVLLNSLRSILDRKLSPHFLGLCRRHCSTMLISLQHLLFWYMQTVSYC